MALGKYILRNLSTILWRSSLHFKEPPRQICERLCVPSRSSSSTSVVNHHFSTKPAEERSELSADDKITYDVISSVNQQIENHNYGRLFAIIHLCGKQFKVTAEDLVVVEGYWPPNVGDKLKLKKVLLVGGSDFTVIGRPILPAGFAIVDATIIEKTLSHTKTIFCKRRRKQFMRLNFHRSEYTILRINSIELTENVNVKKDVEGLETIF